MPATERTLKARQNKLLKALKDAMARETHEAGKLFQKDRGAEYMHFHGKAEGLRIAIRIVEMLGQ